MPKPYAEAPAAIATSLNVAPLTLQGENVLKSFSASISGGGNSLTLTDQRIQISKWTNGCCGCVESGKIVESFAYKDVTHIVLTTGKSFFWLVVGILAVLIGLIGFVTSILNKAISMQPLGIGVVGGLILLWIFMKKGKAMVRIDFSKNVPVEFWMGPSFLPSWLSFGALFSGTARTAYTSRTVLLLVPDAEEATSMLSTRANE